MRLKETLSLLRPKGVLHEVDTGDGEMVEFRFYPVSVGMAYELRGIIEPLTKSLNVLLRQGREAERDAQVVSDTQVDPESGLSNTVTQLGAIPKEMVEYRAAQRNEAIAGVFDAIFSDKNRKLVGRMLANSLREQFKGEDMNEKKMDEFFSELDLGMLYQLLTGFAKANAKVFGPLADKLRTKAKGMMEEVLGSENENVRSTPTSSGSETSSHLDPEEALGPHLP